MFRWEGRVDWCPLTEQIEQHGISLLILPLEEIRRKSSYDVLFWRCVVAAVREKTCIEALIIGKISCRASKGWLEILGMPSSCSLLLPRRIGEYFFVICRLIEYFEKCHVGATKTMVSAESKVVSSSFIWLFRTKLRTKQHANIVQHQSAKRERINPFRDGFNWYG